MRATPVSMRRALEAARTYAVHGILFVPVPVFNEADQLTYFIGIQKDVSRLVDAERRVAELEQQLAEARERIRCLENDQRS